MSTEQQYPELWQIVRDGENRRPERAEDAAAPEDMRTHETVQAIIELFDGQMLSTEETTQEHSTALHERKLARGIQYAQAAGTWALYFQERGGLDDEANGASSMAQSHVDSLIADWTDENNEYEIYPL